MRYRTFGKLGWQISALGFGCMRLPTLGSYEEIDEPEAIRIMRYGIDHGINYLDTGYSYHGGNSERVIGKALKDGYRERVKVATKLPMWQVETADQPERLLNEQLEKLQVEQIDVYLFHGIRQARWDTIQRLDLLRWAERAVADGRVGVLGFSFHDSVALFKTVVDGYDKWAMCQPMYNYMDIERQAGTEGVRYAAAKGLAVVAMEPLLGGNLVNPPPQVQALWDTAPVKRTPADWALAVALEPTRGGGGAQRHEQSRPGEAEHRQRRAVGHRLADRGRAGAGGSGTRPVPAAAAGRLQQVLLLHALPQRRQHSAQLRDLQRRLHVQPRRPGAALLRRAGRRRAGDCLHRVPHLREPLPARDHHQRADAVGR